MRLISCVIFLFFITSNLEASDIINVIDDFYRSFNTLEGKFIQKSTIKELNKTTTFSGKFFMKKDNLHLRYHGKKPNLVYVHNKEMIIYKPHDKTAFKMPFDENKYGQTPLALLSGLIDIKADFNHKEITENRLLLIPVKGMGQIVEIELSVSREKGFPIDTMVILDKHGNKTEIIFQEVVVNSKIDNKIFRFTPPEGTTILQ